MKTTEEHIIKECWECEKCQSVVDHIENCYDKPIVGEVYELFDRLLATPRPH